jgi:hypothetical protein
MIVLCSINIYLIYSCQNVSVHHVTILYTPVWEGAVYNSIERTRRGVVGGGGRRIEREVQRTY